MYKGMHINIHIGLLGDVGVKMFGVVEQELFLYLPIFIYTYINIYIYM